MGAGFYVLFVCYYWLREGATAETYRRLNVSFSIEPMGGLQTFAAGAPCYSFHQQSGH